jgi:hypothetical protein
MQRSRRHQSGHSFGTAPRHVTSRTLVTLNMSLLDSVYIRRPCQVLPTLTAGICVSVVAIFWTKVCPRRLFLKNLTVAQLSKEFLAFYGTQILFTVFVRARHWIPSWASWIQHAFHNTISKLNKNFWEELIAYFPWYDTGHIENDASNNSSIVACVFVTVVTFLPSRCLATIGGFLPSRCLATIEGIHRHTQTATWSHKPTLFWKVS